MSLVSRNVVLWVMLAALPLQGFAAGTHQCPGSAMPVKIGHESAGSARQDCAHNVDMVSAPASATDCKSASGACNQSQAADGKCSLLAACSLVAAPAFPGPAFLSSEPDSTLTLLRIQPDFTFRTGAPERPPRAFA